ncbi:ABC transporter substrate-binding protein [Nocardia sp. NPDC055049]
MTASSPVSRTRRDFLRAAAGAAAIVGGASVLAACSGADSASSATGAFGPIAVQLSWIKNFEFWGEYMAIERGYFAEAGFGSVDLLAGGTSTTAESIVLAGKALIGLSSAPLTAATIVNSGAPLKIIGSTYQKNPFAIGSLADRTPIRTPRDMIGRRIGVQAGGNQTLFSGLLAANHIEPAQVEVVGVGYDESVLTTGKVDGVMTYVNASIGLEQRGYQPVVMGFADNGLPFVAETLTVRQDTIERKRDLLLAYLHADIRGWIDAINDPATACAHEVAIYGKETSPDFAEEYAKGIIQNSQLIVSADTNQFGLFTMTDALIHDNITSLRTIGYDIAADDLFDMSLLREVYQRHPELKVTLSPPTATAPATTPAAAPTTSKGGS